jgi:uncharacterized protein (DUF1015 family)
MRDGRVRDEGHHLATSAFVFQQIRIVITAKIGSNISDIFLVYSTPEIDELPAASTAKTFPCLLWN